MLNLIGGNDNAAPRFCGNFALKPCKYRVSFVDYLLYIRNLHTLLTKYTYFHKLILKR